jgi:hypothetical protein
VDRPDQLVPRWLRTVDHDWWLLGARIGGAVVIGVGVAGAIALAELKHHTTLWTVALVAVLVLALVGAIAALGGFTLAFLSRPVSDAHCATLKASALSVAQSIESDLVCNYGDGYRPDQAFRAHFPTLVKRLAAWDTTVDAPQATTQALHHHLDTAMAEAGITMPQITHPAHVNTEPSYNPTPIRAYLPAVAMDRAEGRLQQVPQLTWRGFGGPGGVQGGGSPVGVFMPGRANDDWISVPPLDGESQDDWQARAQPYMDRVDALVATVYDSGSPYATAVLDARRQLQSFKATDAQTILDALHLVQAREAPRRRRGCESC